MYPRTTGRDHATGVRALGYRSSLGALRLKVTLLVFVQNQVQQGIVDFEFFCIVFDVSHFPELVHELIDARARGADHVREHFLIDRYGDEVGFGSNRGICQHQKNSRQPLLTRIE